MRQVRVAVIDSGVHASHPHVNGVAGGIEITRDGREEADYTDRMGHGTAVAAVIREKAPDAEVFAVKILHDRLATRIEPLLAGIEWAVRNGMHAINLSVGTSNPAHKNVLAAAVARVVEAKIVLVAAYEEGGMCWLPGSLPGALPVSVDWDCPRDECRVETLDDGRRCYRASGYPRPVPVVPPERNLCDGAGDVPRLFIVSLR